MTVIAFDGVNLAWDSRVTTGDRKATRKKHRQLKDGRTIVAAGVLSNLTKARRLLDGNGLPELPEALVEETSIIVFDNGKVWAYDEGSEAVRITHSDAWGSGCEFALGALFTGASAWWACKAACKHSSTCGGKIHVL